MVSHSCSGRNSFVDITSNQAQPLSNFLLIQRHLQILIKMKVQLEDYRPPPLPNPPHLGKEGGRTLLYQKGNRPSAVWTFCDQTQHFQVTRTALDMHRGKQPLNMVLYNVRKVFNIPVSTESTCLLFLDIYTETSYLLFLHRDFFYWFRPKSSKCWRWQNPF